MPWYRVRDNDSHHEFTVGMVDPDTMTVIDKPAADDFGRPLPPKHYVTRAAANKATPTTKSGTPEKKESST